ncbi:hypothetical protein [Anabaena azotica]|uniref:hypothetical protein n=1 Tax=Anabaena azotica TaxID=197653 RepID=UPI001685DF96|nr:hypothetical protein [Anabaena azotica]
MKYNFNLSPNLSPKRSYGVHTSRKIPFSTWFRHLALGCAIALSNLSLRGGTTKQLQKPRDYVITSLRS